MIDLSAPADLLPPDALRPVPTAIVAVDSRLDDIGLADLLKVRSVDDCPSAMLPFIAWEMGVDVWMPWWPDEIKRRVIRASPIVHRHKGTVHAVKSALAALKVRSRVSEWWQESPKGAPYTFSVTAIATERYERTGPLLTPELTQAIVQSVRAAAPKSRAFSVRVHAGLGRDLGTTSAARACSIGSASVRASPTTDVALTAGAAGAARAVSVVSVAMRAAPASRAMDEVGLAGAGRAVAFVFARMDMAA